MSLKSWINYANSNKKPHTQLPPTVKEALLTLIKIRNNKNERGP